MRVLAERGSGNLKIMLHSIAAPYWAHAIFFFLCCKPKCYDIMQHSSFVCASVVLPCKLLHDYASLALPDRICRCLYTFPRSSMAGGSLGESRRETSCALRLSA